MDSKESFVAESERKKLKEDIERLQLVLQEEDDTEFDSDANVLEVDTDDEEKDGDTKSFSISRPSTASEHHTVSESYESECQELSSIRDLEQWHGDAETCLALNRFYQEALVDQLRKIEYALQENRENQRALEEEMGEKYVKKEKKVGKTKSIADYAMPYFKDKDGNCPQPNEDVLLKKKLGEHKQNFQLSASWHSAYRKELITAVRQDTLEKILRPCMSRLELEHEKMAKCKDNDEIAACQERIDKINKEIEEKKEIPSEELLNQVDIDQVDWMKISAVHLNSRFSSKACEYMWKNALQPSINRSRWTKIEEDKLQQLVEIYEMHNWESIAEELATNRTPFQCLQHYQQHLAKSEKGDWTAEEDDLLKEVVDTCRGGQLTIQWNQVAYYLDGRNADDCRNRWVVLDPNIRRGKWTEQENCMLMAAIKLLGPHNWQRIKEFVPGRTSLQCRERWNNSLNPKLKHRSWSYDEDKKLMELVQEKGGKWSEIASMLDGRTDNQVLQRYRRLQEWQKWTDAMEKQPDYVKDQLLSSFSKEKLKRIQEIKIASDTVKSVRESATEEFHQELQEIADRIRDSNMEISEMDYIRQQIDKETGGLVVPRPPLLKRFSVRKFSQTWKRREQLQSLIGFHVDKAIEKNQTQDLKAVAQEATRNVRPVAEIKGHDKWRLINHALKDKNPHEFTVREILDLSRQLADTGEIHPFEEKPRVNQFTVKKHGRSQQSFIKHNDLSRKLRKAIQCHSDKKYLRRRSQTGRPRKFYLFSYKGRQHPDTELYDEDQDAASKTTTVVLMKALGVDYRKIFSVVKSLTPDTEDDTTRTTVKRSKRKFSKDDGEEWEQELLPSYLVEDLEFVRSIMAGMKESEIELVDTKETHEDLPSEIKSLVEKRMLLELPPHIRYRQESACSTATKDKLKELITGVKKKVVEGSNFDSHSRDTQSLAGDKQRQETGTEQMCNVYPSTSGVVSRSKSASQSTIYNKQGTCLTSGQSQKLCLSNSTMKPLIGKGKSLEAYIVYPPVKKDLSSKDTTLEVPNEQVKGTVPEHTVCPQGTQRPVETKTTKEALTTITEYIVYPPRASTMNVHGTSLLQKKELPPTNPHCREKPVNTESRPFCYDKSWTSEKTNEPIYVPVKREKLKSNIQTYIVYPSKAVNSNKQKEKEKICNILEDQGQRNAHDIQDQDKQLDMQRSSRETINQNSGNTSIVTSNGQESCTRETNQSKTQNLNQTPIKNSHHGVVSQSNSGPNQSNETCSNSEADETSKQMGKDGYITQEEDIVMVYPDRTQNSVSSTSNHDGQGIKKIIVPSNGQTAQVTQSCIEGNQIVSSVEQMAVSANQQLSQVTRSSKGSKHNVRTVQEIVVRPKRKKTFSLPYLPPNVTNMYAFRSLLLKRRGLIHDACYWYNQKYYNRKSRTIANKNDPDLTTAMNEMDELADEEHCEPKKRHEYVFDKLYHLRGTPHFDVLRERFKSLFTWCALMSTIYPPAEKDLARIKQPSVVATTSGDPSEGIQEGNSDESSGINQTVNQTDSAECLLSQNSYNNSKQGKNRGYPLAKVKRSHLKKTVAEKRATQQQRAFLKGKDRSPVKRKPGRPKGFKLTKPYQKRPCPPPREGSQRHAALKVREEAEQKLHEREMKKEENKKKKELRILLPQERVAKRVSSWKDLIPSASKRQKMENDVYSNTYMNESSMEASLDSFEACSESVGNTSMADSIVTVNGDEVEQELKREPSQKNRDNCAPDQNGDVNSTKTTETGGGDQGISLVSLPVSRRTDTNQEFVLVPMTKDDRQVTMAIPVTQALSMLSQSAVVNTGLQDSTQVTVRTAMQAAVTATAVKKETGDSSNTKV